MNGDAGKHGRKRVLVVDDSVTFRAAIKATLSTASEFEVCGVAANGAIAIAKLTADPVDLVVLDLEMPELDGLETLRQLKTLATMPRVLLYAAPSVSAYARVAEALALGADDFLAKPAGLQEFDAGLEQMRAELIPRLRALAGLPDRPCPVRAEPARPVSGRTRLAVEAFRPEAVVIASSTGGPVALERLFAQISRTPSVPILIAQHMPPPFTAGLARRLWDLTGVEAAEGVDGERVRSGRIYVAPADYHMGVVDTGAGVTLTVSRGEKINFVRPAADPLFQSAVIAYRGRLAAFVLTGMGEDGAAGATAVKAAGGAVVIQDAASSVVWGMPGAVFARDDFDEVASIDRCADLLAFLTRPGRR